MIQPERSGHTNRFGISPARVLTFALRWLPRDRQLWGDAMLAELHEIPEPGEQWRFTLGCAVAVMFAPAKERSLAMPSIGFLHSTLDWMRRPNAAALIGLLSLLPFVAANAIIATRMEPFFSLIRPGLHTSPREYALLAAVLGLIPVGAYCALRPVIRKDSRGRQPFHILNGAVAVLLLLVFTLLTSALGADIYACDIQQIPNCD